MTSRIWVIPILLASAAPLPAQERPTFQTGVSEVHVDAGVFDQDGRPLTKLVKADFRVFDESEEEKLTGFAAEVATQGLDESRVGGHSGPIRG